MATFGSYQELNDAQVGRFYLMLYAWIDPLGDWFYPSLDKNSERMFKLFKPDSANFQRQNNSIVEGTLQIMFLRNAREWRILFAEKFAGSGGPVDDFLSKYTESAKTECILSEQMFAHFRSKIFHRHFGYHQLPYWY